MLRRMMMLVAVVALMAAMLAASAVTGLAQVPEEEWGSDPRQNYDCSYDYPDEYGEPTGYTDGCV